MVVSLGICAPFMLLIGIIGMLVYGESDVVLILKAQAFIVQAIFGSTILGKKWQTIE